MDWISIFGTTSEQITVTGLMCAIILAQLLAIRALWKELKTKERLLEQLVERYEEIALKYDQATNKLSATFDTIVTQMAGRLFGGSDGK